MSVALEKKKKKEANFTRSAFVQIIPKQVTYFHEPQASENIARE
jgi:hypothetical protein